MSSDISSLEKPIRNAISRSKSRSSRGSRTSSKTACGKPLCDCHCVSKLLCAKMQEHDRIVEEQKEMYTHMTAQCKELFEVKKQLTKSDTKIALMKAENEELKSRLSGKDAEIQNLQEKRIYLQGNFNHLVCRSMEESSKMSSEINEVRCCMKREIQDLHIVVSELTRKVEDLNHTLKERDEQITRMNEFIQFKEAEVKRLQLKLTNVSCQSSCAKCATVALQTKPIPPFPEATQSKHEDHGDDSEAQATEKLTEPSDHYSGDTELVETEHQPKPHQDEEEHGDGDGHGDDDVEGGLPSHYQEVSKQDSFFPTSESKNPLTYAVSVL